MTKFAVALSVMFSALTAQAGLLESKVQSGTHQGENLLALVSQKVPARAVKDAFGFYDRYEGTKRTALIYSVGSEKNKPNVSDFVCDSTGVICRTETVQQTLFANTRYLVIFDLNQSSMTPRLHIVDLTTGDVTSLFASHGKGSTCPKDITRACTFISNRDSESSPLGFFVTGHTYFGEDGWTVPVVGLQASAAGVERNDVPTTIVIHGASYASPDFRRAHGYMGRSLGCPALSFDDIKAWKDRLQDGALFYFFHNSLPETSAPVSNIVAPITDVR